MSYANSGNSDHCAQRIREKTYKSAHVSYTNDRDQDHTAHPRSQIMVFSFRQLIYKCNMFYCIQQFCQRTAKTLIRMRGCTDQSVHASDLLVK